MMQKDLIQSVNDKKTDFAFQTISAGSGCGVPFAQVVQNDSVLRCAKNYLHLCGNMDAEKTPSLFSSNSNVTDLPSDLQAVEKGLKILCVAYTTAASSNNFEVCYDVKKELNSLSGFYQEKVAEAYFSACDILLDADEVVDRAEVLKQLKQSRNSLQQVHCSWPEPKKDYSLASFFEKVDFYGRQLGIDGRVYPEKRAEKFFALAHFSPKITINERGA